MLSLIVIQSIRGKHVIQEVGEGRTMEEELLLDN
jgi:hypothetical protein